MKVIVAIVAFLCVDVIDTFRNLDSVAKCISSTGVDRKLLADFLQGSKDCEGIEACLKCIVEVEGIVQNGAVNVSSLEKLGRGNADAEKQLTVCQGMSADDFCGLSKCLRSVIHIVVSPPSKTLINK